MNSLRPPEAGAQAGLYGGTLLSFLHIPLQDIGQTAVLAITGATVSFFVSLILKRITEREED